MLKKISSLARTDMEKFMGTKVFLQTWEEPFQKDFSPLSVIPRVP